MFSFIVLLAANFFYMDSYTRLDGRQLTSLFILCFFIAVLSIPVAQYNSVMLFTHTYIHVASKVQECSCQSCFCQSSCMAVKMKKADLWSNSLRPLVCYFQDCFLYNSHRQKYIKNCKWRIVKSRIIQLVEEMSDKHFDMVIISWLNRKYLAMYRCVIYCTWLSF